MTDNGPAYLSAAHAIACRALGVRHIRTRPYRPRTNGKAERFIRTMLGGWVLWSDLSRLCPAHRGPIRVAGLL
jgi:transposase InsO family protein